MIHIFPLTQRHNCPLLWRELSRRSIASAARSSTVICAMSYMNSSNSSIGSNMNTSIDTANYPGSPATSQVSLSSQVTHVTRGSLLKRKDYLGVDQKAHSHPNRTYYYKNHDFDDIIDTCSKKLEIDAEDVKALFLRGSAYFKKRMFEAAVTDFSILLQHEPNNTEGLYQRGLALMKLNEYSAALDDFTVVLDKNPDHVNAAFSRATCQSTLGNIEEAIKDYGIALRKDEESSVNCGGRILSQRNFIGISRYNINCEASSKKFRLSFSPQQLVERASNSMIGGEQGGFVIGKMLFKSDSSESVDETTISSTDNEGAEFRNDTGTRNCSSSVSVPFPVEEMKSIRHYEQSVGSKSIDSSSSCVSSCSVTSNSSSSSYDECGCTQYDDSDASYAEQIDDTSNIDEDYPSSTSTDAVLFIEPTLKETIVHMTKSLSPPPQIMDECESEDDVIHCYDGNSVIHPTHCTVLSKTTDDRDENENKNACGWVNQYFPVCNTWQQNLNLLQPIPCIGSVAIGAAVIAVAAASTVMLSQNKKQ